jgi:hypothetical protein
VAFSFTLPLADVAHGPVAVSSPSPSGSDTSAR